MFVVDGSAMPPTFTCVVFCIFCHCVSFVAAIFFGLVCFCVCAGRLYFTTPPSLTWARLLIDGLVSNPAKEIRGTTFGEMSNFFALITSNLSSTVW